MTYVPQSVAQAEREKVINEDIRRAQAEYDRIAEGQDDRLLASEKGGLLGGLGANLFSLGLSGLFPGLAPWINNPIMQGAITKIGTEVGGEMAYEQAGGDMAPEFQTDFRFNQSMEDAIQDDIDIYEEGIQEGISDTAELAGYGVAASGFMTGVSDYFGNVAAGDVLEQSVLEMATDDINKLQTYAVELGIEGAGEMGSQELVSSLLTESIPKEANWLADLNLSNTAYTTLSGVQDNIKFYQMAIQDKGPNYLEALGYGLTSDFNILNTVSSAIQGGVDLYGREKAMKDRKRNISIL